MVARGLFILDDEFLEREIQIRCGGNGEFSAECINRPVRLEQDQSDQCHPTRVK